MFLELLLFIEEKWLLCHRMCKSVSGPVFGLCWSIYQFILDYQFYTIVVKATTNELFLRSVEVQIAIFYIKINSGGDESSSH